MSGLSERRPILFGWSVCVGILLVTWILAALAKCCDGSEAGVPPLAFQVLVFLVATISVIAIAVHLTLGEKGEK